MSSVHSLVCAPRDTLGGIPAVVQAPPQSVSSTSGKALEIAQLRTGCRRTNLSARLIPAERQPQRRWQARP